MKQTMVVMAFRSPAMKESVRAVKRLISSEIRWSGLSASLENMSMR